MDVRFKLDENLPASLGAVFKAHSLDIVTKPAASAAENLKPKRFLD